MINDMLPNDTFEVGVYRTLEEVFEGEDIELSGIIFRKDNQVLVSNKGIMNIINLDIVNKEFNYAGIPDYEGFKPSMELNDLKVETVTTIKYKGTSKVVKPTEILKKIKAIGKKKDKSNVPSSAEEPKTKTIGLYNSKQEDVPEQEQEAVKEKEKQTINEGYEKAIEKANLSPDELIAKVAQSKAVNPKNVEVLKAIKPHLKDAYEDGNTYVFIATLDTEGRLTNGIVEDGKVKFTPEDWEFQSDLVKKYR